MKRPVIGLLLLALFLLPLSVMAAGQDQELKDVTFVVS